MADEPQNKLKSRAQAQVPLRPPWPWSSAWPPSRLQATEIGPGPRYPAVLHRLLEERPARPWRLGRLHAGGLLPAPLQGPGRRSRPEPRPGRRHPRAPRAGAGDRHGPQARPAVKKALQPLDEHVVPRPRLDRRHRDRQELGEILEAARQAVLSSRQDRIVELWTRGWTVPDIGPPSNCRRPGSATRSTRPSASSSVSSPINATTSASPANRI